MKLNYQDISNLVADLRYAIQVGGNPFQMGGAGDGSLAKIKEALVSFVMILIFAVILYVIYILVFQGYWRILYDLVTFSLYKKQNIDKLFTENRFFFSHYKFMLKNDTSFGGVSPFVAYRKIFKINIRLNEIFQNYDANIATLYPGYKYSARYVKAFKDYYLLNNEILAENTGKKIYMYEQLLINPKFKPPQCKNPIVATSVAGSNQKSMPDKGNCPAPEYWVEKYPFYAKIYQDMKQIGAYKPKPEEANQPDEFHIAKLYYLDKIGETKYFSSMTKLNTFTKIIEERIGEAMKRLSINPFMLYLMIPENDDFKMRFGGEYKKFYNRLYKGADSLFEQESILANVVQDELTWYYFEMIYCILNNITYDDIAVMFDKKVASLSYETRLFLTSYMSLPKNSKKKVNRTLLLNYPDTVDFDENIINMITKFPIFSNIYFNDNPKCYYNKKDNDGRVIIIPESINKATLYNTVIKVYDYFLYTKGRPPKKQQKPKSDNVDYLAKLFGEEKAEEPAPPEENVEYTVLSKKDKSIGTEVMSNFIMNAKNFKDFSNCVFVLDLYYNQYKQDIIDRYNEQDLRTNEFFIKLWLPYFKEIFVNRIGQYAKRLFASDSTQKSRGRFRKIWKLVGKAVMMIKKEIKKSFTRSVKSPDEPPPEKDTTSV